MILADKLYFHKLKAGCMIQQFDIISHDMVQGKKTGNSQAKIWI
jgi:hypothetical protein